MKVIENEYVDKMKTIACPNLVKIYPTEPNKSPLGPDWKSKPCVVIQKYFQEYAERIKNFEVREDDVWVVTFPKCGKYDLTHLNCTNCIIEDMFSEGTTWTQEITWLINNDLDFETAKKVDLNTRSHFLEFVLILLYFFFIIKMQKRLF